MPYANTGETVKAIQACRVSLRIDPAQPNVFIELGACYRRLERLEEAVEAFADAARLNPKALERLDALDPSQAAESHEKHVGGHP